MTILVITTGGTIGAMPYEDLVHPPKVKPMPPPGKDLVREALARQFPSIKTRCISLEPIDSQFMDEGYRRKIVELINAGSETEILVTHGTDTILQTADFFYKTILHGKAVVLTGAMVPLDSGPDGYLNLKSSLQQLERIAQNGRAEAGIYIVLCDYQVPESQSGWKPHLYRFEPGLYEKFYDPQDSRRDRIRHIEK